MRGTYHPGEGRTKLDAALAGKECVVLSREYFPMFEPSIHVYFEPSKDLPEGLDMWIDSDEFVRD